MDRVKNIKIIRSISSKKIVTEKLFKKKLSLCAYVTKNDIFKQILKNAQLLIENTYNATILV